MARDGRSSRDGYAIASPREFVHQFLVLRIDLQALPSSTRTDLKWLAQNAAACDPGLDCSEPCVTALQLCAHSGTGGGGAIDRYAQSLPNPTDREQLTAENRRAAAAVVAGEIKARGVVAERFCV